MKITPKKYAQALADTLEKGADSKQVIRNFLLILRRRKQSRLLAKILKAFESEWAVRMGIVKLRVAYPTRFSAVMQEFEAGLSASLGKSVEIEKKPIGSMLGGLMVKMGDTLIDASLEARLRSLSRRFNS